MYRKESPYFAKKLLFLGVISGAVWMAFIIWSSNTPIENTYDSGSTRVIEESKKSTWSNLEKSPSFEDVDVMKPGSECHLFCDSTGYEPVWITNMGKHQAQQKCINIMMADEDWMNASTDELWCNEFNGWIFDGGVGSSRIIEESKKSTWSNLEKSPSFEDVDVMKPGSECHLFCDSTGYEPVWITNMGKHQAQQKCINIMMADEDWMNASTDELWCNEFNGWIFDGGM